MGGVFERLGYAYMTTCSTQTVTFVNDLVPERPISQSNSTETTQQEDAMHKTMFPKYENYGNHNMYGQRSGDARLPSPIIGEDLPNRLGGLTSHQEDHVQ